MMNILNGGAHADSSVDFQEFMVMPVGMPTFAEALRAGAEIFHALRAILKKGGHSTGVGDEGGFAPNLRRTVRRSTSCSRPSARRDTRPVTDVFIALDVASSELWDNGTYVFRKSGEPTRTAATRWSSYGATGCGNTRSSRSKTALAEGDWEGWKALTRALGDRVQLVGDDVFVTNPGDPRRGDRRTASATRCS